MGTEVNSMWLMALKGTWPPVGKTLEDEIVPPNAAVEAAVERAVVVLPVAPPAVAAPGPLETLEVDVPPETKPVAVAGIPVPVRINRFLRSMGPCWNDGATSSTTWYWFN